MQVTKVGLDLAKNIFQMHGITEDGTVAFNKSLRRSQLLDFFKNLEPCLIGMEACGSLRTSDASRHIGSEACGHR